MSHSESDDRKYQKNLRPGNLNKPDLSKYEK
jgi:hypothetical protein